MSSKRRNPKKNKAARRPRRDMPGLRRAQLSLEEIYPFLEGASPEALPLVALPSMLMWSAAQDRAAAAHCVEAQDSRSYGQPQSSG